MKRIHIVLIISILLISTLACQTVSSLLQSQAGDSIIEEPSTLAWPTPEVSERSVVITQQGDLAELFEQVNPGVVAIQTLTAEGGGLGSGFVYDKEGHIITNYHVVEGATDLEVDFPSGLKVRGEVIATDTDSDIAVIKISASPDQLLPLPLGDSDALQVGNPVVAIGNPFGLSSTMTSGIVSAKGRTMESMRQSPAGNYFTAAGLIQTDAPINPGNSGGPLLDLQGNVVGINRAIQTNSSVIGGEAGNIGIGFAIPINIVKRVVPELISSGSYDYPYLGLSSLDNISLMVMEELGLQDSYGAYITSIVSNGPAERAGLRAGDQATSIEGLYKGGDWIIAVDGMRIRNFDEFLTYLIMNKRPGDTVVMTIVREGKQMDVSVELDRRP
jgi:S1-C subfamily serine protease